MMIPTVPTDSLEDLLHADGGEDANIPLHKQDLELYRNNTRNSSLSIFLCRQWVLFAFIVSKTPSHVGNLREGMSNVLCSSFPSFLSGMFRLLFFLTTSLPNNRLVSSHLISHAHKHTLFLTLSLSHTHTHTRTHA
mmetsp:Transcript_40167/g.45268  ORF Transcript_40167/g.45268 Transcript_40167/m.45268 type:complete len:136 (+) Transcript_40167:268-675(+)